jgi:hypothetical protein
MPDALKHGYEHSEREHEAMANHRSESGFVVRSAQGDLLLDDPDQELAAIRPRLARWWNRHHDNFVRQGTEGIGTRPDDNR